MYIMPGRSSKSNFIHMFKTIFSGTMGYLAALTLTALFSLAFFLPGYLLIKKYNKQGSKPLQDLQKEQYVGIVLCVIGLLPWMKYFFAGFMFETGSFVFNEIFE